MRSSSSRARRHGRTARPQRRRRCAARPRRRAALPRRPVRTGRRAPGLLRKARAGADLRRRRRPTAPGVAGAAHDLGAGRAAMPLEARRRGTAQHRQSPPQLRRKAALGAWRRTRSRRRSRASATDRVATTRAGRNDGRSASGRSCSTTRTTRDGWRRCSPWLMATRGPGRTRRRLGFAARPGWQPQRRGDRRARLCRRRHAPDRVVPKEPGDAARSSGRARCQRCWPTALAGGRGGRRAH